jgi:hypothetical protein
MDLTSVIIQSELCGVVIFGCVVIATISYVMGAMREMYDGDA